MNYQRFVVFLVSLLICVAIGVTTYYFMKDEEYIFLQTQEVNVNVGEKFKLEFKHDNPLKSTKISWEIQNKDLLSYDQASGVFTAKSGGSTEVWLNTTRRGWKVQRCFVKIGDGTAENPTIIKDYSSLANIDSNGHYILVSDIDLQGKDWAPLCTSGAFAGELNGNGHTIKNLTISANAELINAGLFGEITYTGYVHDLKLDNVNISGNITNLGAVAGVNKGLIEKVSVTTAKLSSMRETSIAYIGGIAGVASADAGSVTTELNYSTFGRIDRCGVTDAELFGRGNANVGGLTAKVEGGFVLNSYFIGEIKSTATDDVVGAGITANLIATKKSNAKLKDNYAVVRFTNIESKAGIVFTNNFSAYTDSTTSALISENIIWGQYYDLNVCNDNNVKGVEDTGYADSTTYDARVQDGKIVAKGVSSDFLKLKESEQTAIYSHTNYKGQTGVEKDYNYDFLVTWKISAEENGGYPMLQMGGKADDGIINITGSEEPSPIDPIEDGTLHDKLQQCKEGERIVLGSDVDWGGKDWAPIGTEENPFNGILEGRGTDGKQITISNINVVGGEGGVKGLFGVLGSSARIENIVFKNVKIESADNFEYVGVIAGKNYGTLITVGVIDYSITGGVNIGGAVGYNGGVLDYVVINNISEEIKGINIENSTNTERVGGLVAVNAGTISASENDAEFTVRKSNDTSTLVGGLVGENNGYITESICRSNILIKASNSRVGGIVGLNTSSVNRVAYKGSITGNTDNSEVYVAGIAGYNLNGGKIEKSSAQGTLTGYNVAGLVGYNASNESKISECNVMNMTLIGEQVGGLVTTMSLGKMENCSVVATARGLSKDSTKAGFAVVVAGGTDITSNGNCARVENCFAGVKYEGEGRNWAETTSKVRVSLANSNALKQGGFIKNCIYDSTLAKGASTQGGSTTIFGNNNSGNYDGNRYDNLDGRTSTADCYLASTYSKDNRNWDNANIWTLGNNEYPKVKTAKTID